jgi:AcrR family transcriptional regulator
VSASAEPTSTRERILIASAELFRRQGYAATGLKQVVARADAPFGSLYHHFPQGKEQLGDEVLRAGGAFFLALFEHVADAAPDVVSGVRDFFSGAGEALAANGYADACPIATVAGEVASSNETLRKACADVFESWLHAAQRRFEAAGISPLDARDLALSVIALLEGAFLLSRSLRSTDPMAAGGDAAAALVAAAVRREERKSRS